MDSNRKEAAYPESVNKQSELFFLLLKFAMPTNYTDEAIKNIVAQFMDSNKHLCS